jgi:hypothetical protein
MKTLDLTERKLSNISQFDENVERLWVNNNLLTELPTLPQGLRILSCRKNLLTKLPPLPDTLRELSCRNNPMSQLPPLPLSLELIFISPWQVISCLNKLSNMKTRIKIIN